MTLPAGDKDTVKYEMESQFKNRSHKYKNPLETGWLPYEQPCHHSFSMQ